MTGTPPPSGDTDRLGPDRDEVDFERKPETLSREDLCEEVARLRHRCDSAERALAEQRRQGLLAQGGQWSGRAGAGHDPRAHPQGGSTTEDVIRAYARRCEQDEIQFVLERYPAVLNRLRERQAGPRISGRPDPASPARHWARYGRRLAIGIASSARSRASEWLPPGSLAGRWARYGRSLAIGAASSAGLWRGGAPPGSLPFARQHRYFSRYFADGSEAGRPRRGARRILIDVSQTTQVDVLTGIPRVVTNIARGAVARGAIPVFFHDASLWTFRPGDARPQPVAITEGDCFLMADSGWNRSAEMKGIMSDISAHGGINVVVHYDMLPILYPSFFPQSFEAVFRLWYESVVLQSDAVVAISASVAGELVDDVRRSGVAYNPAMRVGWQHLGADFKAGVSPIVSAAIADLTRGDRPIVLCVSTLEPRKGYGIVLDAMSSLWSDGADILLVIVGHYGWNSLATANRIQTHPDYGRRLHWFEEAGDGDLERLYMGAHCLVYASVAEGFGLPIIEAARYGLAVIASDIPVFREIGNDSVTYFPVGDGVALAREIRRMTGEPKRRVAPFGLTWDRASEELVDLIDTGLDRLGRLGDLVNPS